MSYQDILEMRIGLLLGIINEKCNQLNKQEDKPNEEEEIVHGDAKMLMKM